MKAAKISVALIIGLVLLVGLVGWLLVSRQKRQQDSGRSPVKALIDSVSPTRVKVGQQIIITGHNFATSDPHNDIIFFSPSLSLESEGNDFIGYLNGVRPSDGQKIVFDLPRYLGACPSTAEACIEIALELTAGEYRLAVINDRGQSNAKKLSVN